MVKHRNMIDPRRIDIAKLIKNFHIKLDNHSFKESQGRGQLIIKEEIQLKV